MLKIKKNDQVKVMLGKDRGKTGKVLRVLNKEDKVLVEGVNSYKRHIRKMGQQEGRIMEMFRAMNVSNVQLICSKCKLPTRVGFKLEGDQKLRICLKCKAVN